MNRFSRLAFGLTILAFGAAPLHAAGKMVPGEGAIEVMLLRQDSVQKELKLTEPEIEKVNKHCAHQWEKAQAVSKLSEKEQTVKYTEMAKENAHFVEATLTKEQQKRLHQVTLQIAGLLCLNREDVSRKLKLTAEQKKKLPQLHKESHQEVEDLLYVTKKEEKRAKLRELRETSHKRLLELLTDEQEVTWKEMIGAPFTGDLAYFDVDSAAK